MACACTEASALCAYHVANRDRIAALYRKELRLMRVTLESTTKIVELVVNGQAVPARIWEGTTAGGIACHAYITRIAVSRTDDASEFERELQSQRDPINPDIAALPRRMVI